MDTLRPKEKEQFGFGVDDKVRVEYRLENGEQSTSGLFTDNQHVERRYRIEIANHHSKPMEVTVLDPCRCRRTSASRSRSSATPPAPPRPTGKPTRASWLWTYDLKPAEERVIDFGYSLTYPEGTIVAGM